MSGSIPFCEGLTTVISTVFNKGKLGTGNGEKKHTTECPGFSSCWHITNAVLVVTVERLGGGGGGS